MKSYLRILILALFLPAASPAASLTDMRGQGHDLAQAAAGSPLVLVFWQSWCGPCKKEAPSLAAAARQHAAGLKFFGVVSGPDKSVDERKVSAFIKKYDLPYPQLRDRDLALTKSYGVEGTPTILVLDKDMRVLFSGHRAPNDWSQFYK